MVAYPPPPIKMAGAPDLCAFGQAAARPNWSEGCDGRLGLGKLNATATAAIPMPKEPT
jgi:hypothetical protein